MTTYLAFIMALFLRTETSTGAFLSNYSYNFPAAPNTFAWQIIKEQKESKITKTLTVWLTAYSSTPEETDDTPFITAMNTTVRPGIVATNILPFKTKIMIPEVFGEEILVVEDRMHSRKTDFVDIWMPSKEDAINFGIRKAEILVLE